MQEDDSIDNYYDNTDFADNTLKPGTKFIRKLKDCESDCESECILVNIEKQFNQSDKEIRYYINYTKDGNPRSSKIEFNIFGLAYGSHLFSDGKHSFYIMKHDDSLYRNPSVRKPSQPSTVPYSRNKIYDEDTDKKLYTVWESRYYDRDKDWKILGLEKKWIYMKTEEKEYIGQIKDFIAVYADKELIDAAMGKIDLQSSKVWYLYSGTENSYIGEIRPSITCKFNKISKVEKNSFRSGKKLVPKTGDTKENYRIKITILEYYPEANYLNCTFEIFVKGAAMTSNKWVGDANKVNTLTEFRIFEDEKKKDTFVRSLLSVKTGGKTKRGRRMLRKKTVKRRSGIHRKRK
jgi:hypothetical protein